MGTKEPRMAKTKFTVILDCRNRELRYVHPCENVAREIERLKEEGKKPFRTITKMK